MSTRNNRMVSELAQQDPEEGAQDPTPEQKLAEFFGQAPADVSVGIYEIDPARPREPAFLFSIPSSELPSPHELLAQILEKWGAGRYESMAQDQKGKIVFKTRFTVGTDRDRKRALIPSRHEADAPSTAAAAPAGGLSPELRAILEQQNRVLEALAQAVTARPEPAQAHDPFDVIERLGKLKHLFVPENPAPQKDVLELVKDFLQIKETLRESDTEAADPLSSAVKYLAPAITSAVERMQQGQEQTRAAALERAAAGAGGHQAERPPAANGYSGMLSHYTDPLIDMAARGTEVPAAAQWVVNTLAQQPPAIAEAVLDFLDDEQSTQRLTAMVPKLEPHAEWLDQVVNAVLQAVEDQARASADQGSADQTPDPPGADASEPKQPKPGAEDAQRTQAR